MIWALLLLDQVPHIGFEQDRKAFEPYRQCMLSHARQQYQSGNSLKIIFRNAERACAAQEVTTAAQLELNALERAMKASPNGPYRPDSGERLSIFYQELLFEVANDFVPKVK